MAFTKQEKQDDESRHSHNLIDRRKQHCDVRMACAVCVFVCLVGKDEGNVEFVQAIVINETTTATLPSNWRWGGGGVDSC